MYPWDRHTLLRATARAIINVRDMPIGEVLRRLAASSMNSNAFFVPDDEASRSSGIDQLRHDLLKEAGRSPLSGKPDLDVCETLVRMVTKEFTARGTGGIVRITNRDSRLLLRVSAVVCRRASISFPELTFCDLDSFREFWIKNGMDYSYQKRCTHLEGLFRPIEDEILSRSIGQAGDDLLDPVSPHSGTGWAEIDEEVRQLRQRFAVARTDQDHCAVGAACVRILELLAERTFDPKVHLGPGAPLPTRDKTKDRFDAVIVHALPGSENERLRKLGRAVIEVAHEVKHRKTPTRRDAGVASDSVIMLVQVLRRLEDGGT